MNQHTVFLLLITFLALASCNPKTEQEQTQTPPTEETITENSETISSTETEIAETTNDEIASINFFKKNITVTKIDTELEQCLEEHYSTAEVILCTGAAIDAWDKALNIFYKKALKVSGTKEKTALQKAQRNWVNFKMAEEKFIDETLNNFDGSLYRITAISDKLFVTEVRALEMIRKSFGQEDYDEALADFVDKTMEDYFGKDSVYLVCEANDMSNLGMRQCAYQAAEHYDKILNEYYKKLSKLLNKKGKALFKKTQLNWIKYRDSEVAIYDAIYEDVGGGSMYPTMQAQRKANVVRQRAFELQSHYESYQAMKD